MAKTKPLPAKGAREGVAMKDPKMPEKTFMASLVTCRKCLALSIILGVAIPEIHQERREAKP